MEVTDHEHTEIGSLLDDGIKVLQVDFGEMLARVHDVPVDPVPHGDADGVEARVMDLLDVVWGDSLLVVSVECRVCLRLARLGHTVELGLALTGGASDAIHLAPFLRHHPQVRNEPSPEVDAAVLGWQVHPLEADSVPVERLKVTQPSADACYGNSQEKDSSSSHRIEPNKECEFDGCL